MSKLEDDLKNVISQNREIVKQLMTHRIFSVEYSESEKHGEWLNITEACDGYYEMELTKESCLALSKYFKELWKIL